jgi:hypothetical protein
MGSGVAACAQNEMLASSVATRVFMRRMMKTFTVPAQFGRDETRAKIGA